MAKQKEETEKMPNRFRDELALRTADDNALKANLSSPANLKQYNLDKIKYLNDLERKFGNMINPDEKRWQNHIKINRNELVKEVYNTPLKKLGRMYAKMFPKSASRQLWSKVKQTAGKLGSFLKDNAKRGVQSVVKNTRKVVGEVVKRAPEVVASASKALGAVKDFLLTSGIKVLDFIGQALSNHPPSNEQTNQRNPTDSFPRIDDRPSLFEQLKTRLAEINRAKYLKQVQTFPVDHLKDLLMQKGFGSLIPELENAIARGDKDFKLTANKIINNEPVKQELTFSDSKDGKLRFESVRTVIRDPNDPGSFKEIKLPVNGSKTFSSEQSYSLLKGDTVCRHEVDSADNIVKVLYRLNENDMKYNPRNARVDQFVANEEHVKNVVYALPHPPGTTRESMDRLVHTLVNGGKPLVPLQENGVKTSVHMQVGTIPGLMKYSDVNDKSLKYSEVKQILNPPKNVSEKIQQKKGNRNRKKNPKIS